MKQILCVALFIGGCGFSSTAARSGDLREGSGVADEASGEFSPSDGPVNEPAIETQQPGISVENIEIPPSAFPDRPVQAQFVSAIRIKNLSDIAGEDAVVRLVQPEIWTSLAVNPGREPLLAVVWLDFDRGDGGWLAVGTYDGAAPEWREQDFTDYTIPARGHVDVYMTISTDLLIGERGNDETFQVVLPTGSILWSRGDTSPTFEGVVGLPLHGYEFRFRY